MSKKEKEKTAKELILSQPVPDLIKLVDKKIADMKKIEETVYKTSASTSLPGFSNVRSETNIRNLLRMGSTLLAMKRAYERFAAEINIKKYPEFTFHGNSYDEYKHDIELRIDIIKHKDTFEKLKEFKESIKSVMSIEDRKAVLAQELATFLGENG